LRRHVRLVRHLQSNVNAFDSIKSFIDVREPTLCNALLNTIFPELLTASKGRRFGAGLYHHINTLCNHAREIFEKYSILNTPRNSGLTTDFCTKVKMCLKGFANGFRVYIGFYGSVATVASVGLTEFSLARYENRQGASAQIA